MTPDPTGLIAAMREERRQNGGRLATDPKPRKGTPAPTEAALDDLLRDTGERYAILREVKA